jgi:hypothetical protein
MNDGLRIILDLRGNAIRCWNFAPVVLTVSRKSENKIVSYMQRQTRISLQRRLGIPMRQGGI